MKINEIIVEGQLDELSLGGIGKGIGKAIGGITGAWDQAKAGYQSGKQSAYNWARGRPQADTTAATTSTGQTTVAPGTTATTPAVAPAPSPATTPAASATAPGTTPAGSTTSSTAPASSATPAASTATPPVPAAASTPAASKSQLAADPYNTYKQQMRGQTVPKPGAKPLPQKFVDQINKDLSVFAKGSKDWGVNVADKLVKYGNQGYDVSQLANQWNANAKLVDRMKEGFLYTSEYNQLCEILREHGISWGDLGLQIRIVESVTDGVFFGYKKTSNSFNVVFN